MYYDWDRLVREMEATKEFHRSGLDADSLHRAHHVKVVKGRRIVAYAARDEMIPGCFEIRKVFVAKDANGNGAAEEMMRQLMADHPGADFFLVTRSRKLERVIIRIGFRVRTKFNMPNIREWAKRVGLGKRLPRSATAKNPHHSNRRKRWLWMLHN